MRNFWRLKVGPFVTAGLMAAACLALGRCGEGLHEPSGSKAGGSLPAVGSGAKVSAVTTAPKGISVSTRPADGLYVARDGNDANSGTMDKPLLTISKALTMINPGGTILLRGGTYTMPAVITISKSGTAEKPYTLAAYPGEKPVLDFSAGQVRSRGLTLAGSYWQIKGLEITGAVGGMSISGSYNTVEMCSLHDNRETGMQMGGGASYNRVINCDSYCNADAAANYANADGFAPKLTVGTGDYFYGCRSWLNCDDGWDGYMRGANDVTTVLENCWTFRNGYLKDGTDPGRQANGNGFKMGGGDNGNSQNLMHHFILKNCMAFENKVRGFDQNNNVGSMTLLNCTGFKNGGGNFVVMKALVPGQKLIVKNCVSLDGDVRLASFAIQEKNSWLMATPPTAVDFFTIDPASATAPRKPDGSLPDLKFMHLAAGSKLIHAGVDVGLPFVGAAPDLGAFPFGGN